MASVLVLMFFLLITFFAIIDRRQLSTSNKLSFAMKSYAMWFRNTFPLDLNLNIISWMKNWQAVTQNYWMINHSALAFGRRIYVRALVVIGSPAYAEGRAPVVIDGGKIPHIWNMQLALNWKRKKKKKKKKHKANIDTGGK